MIGLRQTHWHTYHAQPLMGSIYLIYGQTSLLHVPTHTKCNVLVASGKTYLKVWMSTEEPNPGISRHGSARKVGDQHPNPKVQEGLVGWTHWDKMQGVTGYEEF